MSKKILITGFEPFDQDLDNPSGDWVSWMKNRPKQAGLEVLGEILPVTFGGAFVSFKKICDDFSPDYIVLTGLAKNRSQLTVERIGINWVDARIPDNDGVQIRAQKIDESGPDGLFTTISVEEIISLSEKTKCPVKLSTSAGEYVCNDLLYKVLCYSRDKKIPATFIHLPGASDYSEIFLALEAIINGFAKK